MGTMNSGWQNTSAKIIRQGWQCPVCLHVYSPDTSVCFYCPPKVKASNSTNDSAHQREEDE
jgi:uncharacterized OB-fold protein